MKQWEMQNQHKKFKNLKFVIGDVRDKERMFSVLNGSIMFFTQLQQKLFLVQSPRECIKTNVGSN